MKSLQKITPFLWYDGTAEEAARFYCGLFGGQVTDIMTAPEGGLMPAGSVLTVSFELAGQTFIAMNGGPAHPLTEAFSMFVTCDSDEEADQLWDGLTAEGGSGIACGWLKDKYGLRWQIIPPALFEAMRGPDAAGRARAFGAMMTMTKIDGPAIRAAYEDRA